MRKKLYIMDCLFSIASCVILIIVQELCPQKSYSLRSYLIIAIVLVIAGISFVILKLNIENEKKIKIQERNERAQKILSNITELVKCKSKFYRQNTYKINFVRKEMPYYYNIHAYLYEVCQNLRSTIADIINQDISYVDVSLVYKYCDEKMWKWIAGKSGTSAATDLNEFIKNKDTLFNYVLENEDERPTFCNDKKENKHYKKGRRDRLFDGQGSYYAMPITFSNNKKGLVEAILIISTYGVNFIPVKSNEKERKEFNIILSHEVVPYYVEVIQAELGALYIRHKLKEKLKDKEKQDKFIKNIID